jgi:hypothetical protein
MHNTTCAGLTLVPSVSDHRPATRSNTVMGNLWGSVAAAIFISLLERLALGQPGPGGHRVVRRADPDPVVPAHGPVRSDPEMTRRRAVVHWTGFAVILALLIAAPLVLPEFWRRFVTEILIWGLLAIPSFRLALHDENLAADRQLIAGARIYDLARPHLAVSAWMRVSPKPTIASGRRRSPAGG